MRQNLNPMQLTPPQLNYPHLSGDQNATPQFPANEAIILRNSFDICPLDIKIRHLEALADIQEIQNLRGEIDLDLHRSIDPRFEEHEKKEMS